MIVIYNRNDSGQYYETTITITYLQLDSGDYDRIFTILAKAKAKANLS